MSSNNPIDPNSSSGILDQLLDLSRQLFENSIQQIGSKKPFIASNSPSARLLDAAAFLQTAGLLLELSTESNKSIESNKPKSTLPILNGKGLIKKSIVKKPSKFSKQIEKSSRTIDKSSRKKFSMEDSKPSNPSNPSNPSRNLRKVLDEPIPWTVIYMGILHELKKLEYLNLVFPDDIPEEQILTYDTFIKSHAYAEFTVHLSKNLIVPIGNAPIYPNSGMCSSSLDNLVYELLINSIKVGAWKLQMERTTDGVKFYTYINNSIKIQKSHK